MLKNSTLKEKVILIGNLFSKYNREQKLKIHISTLQVNQAIPLQSLLESQRTQNIW